MDANEMQELIDSLLSEFNTEELNQKYGTSLPFNMTKEYRAELERQYKRLLKEFDEVDKDDNEIISKTELLEFVNKGKTEDKHTAAYVKKLFDVMDRNHDNEITMLVSRKEFILSFMRVSEKIKIKIATIERIMVDLNTTKGKYERAAQKTRNEAVNGEGVSTESFLEVTVISAEDVKPMDFNGRSDPYCVIDYDNHSYMTQSRPETLNPVWNESFKFKVKSLTPPLKITVFDKDNIGSDDVEGCVFIPMDKLKHQEAVEEFFPLKGEDFVSESEGRIRLKLQLVYSKYAYNTEKARQMAEYIRENEATLAELEQYRQSLDKPFGLIRNGHIVEILESQVVEKRLETGRSSVMFKPKRGDHENVRRRVENIFGGVTSKALNREKR